MENKDNLYPNYIPSKSIDIPNPRNTKQNRARFSLLDVGDGVIETERNSSPEDCSNILELTSGSTTPEIFEIFSSTPKDLLSFHTTIVSPKHDKIITLIKTFHDFEKLLCSYANDSDVLGFIQLCQRFSSTYLSDFEGITENSEISTQIKNRKDPDTLGFRIAYLSGNYKLLEVIATILKEDELISTICRLNDPNTGITSSSEKFPRESISDSFIQLQNPLIKRSKSIRAFFEYGYKLEEIYKSLEMYKTVVNFRLTSSTFLGWPDELRLHFCYQIETSLPVDVRKAIISIAWPNSENVPIKEGKNPPITPVQSPVIRFFSNFFNSLNLKSDEKIILDYSIKGMIESREKTIDKILSVIPNKHRLDHAELER